jgi:hypothetical protein
VSAAIQRRIANLEKQHHGQYLTVIDVLRHIDTGEPLPDRPVDPKLKDFLERTMDAKH